MVDIKVGDIVEVIDCGLEFTTYSDFFEEHRKEIFENNVSLGHIANYFKREREYEKTELKYNKKYKVLFIGKHRMSYYENPLAFIIDMDDSDNTYLISVNGLKKHKTKMIKEMTKEQIEKLLGYEIEIV